MKRRLTPVKAIRKKCLDCSETSNEIRNCPCFEDNGAIQKCPLYPYRMGKRPNEKAKYTPVKAIRRYCLWCCCGDARLVKECTVKDCPLWNYRMGTNPARKGKGGLGVNLKCPYNLKSSHLYGVFLKENLKNIVTYHPVKNRV